jgi:thiamine monophosphate kinase
LRRFGEHRIIEFDGGILRFCGCVGWVGDDVAAVPLKTGEGEVAVLKTDMLVAKTDVPVGMTLWQAARKAIVAPVSDFAAKGAVPVAVQVAVGFPSKFLQAQVRKWLRLEQWRKRYDAYIVGVTRRKPATSQ